MHAPLVSYSSAVNLWGVPTCGPIRKSYRLRKELFSDVKPYTEYIHLEAEFFKINLKIASNQLKG